jgi:citrate lyase subunit beta/citryl-CoA lyase
VPYYVRTNAVETGLLWDDVVAAGRSPAVGVIIPKAEDPQLIAQLDTALTVMESESGREQRSITIIPLVESARGVMRTYDMAVASDRVKCVMFGGGEQGDLVADLGAEWTPEGTGLMYARAHVLLAARAAGVPYPMEAVFMDFRNPDGLRVECDLARTLGYVGKVAIHPAQIDMINEVFTPDAELVAYNRKVLAAFEEAEADGEASIAVDGKMVDYAVARVARAVIARAEAAARAAETN